ncbi:putative clathrin assembly protein At2g25430 [Glycine max]|uniref:putative clathrin assembly protein At2g25430 n=1 Tax=Glycine max TaxID=3847 RepID=UPI0007193915|nr:putative clathrin assembly protein At2g25430 [Glycine max]|eukprot:XP_014618077.1 putative clathrin assembly protein At2g25430 [Glycine max]
MENSSEDSSKSHGNRPSITRFHNLCFVFLFTLDSTNASLVTISKRSNKTRDWIVAIKALLLVHRLLLDAHPAFQDEIMHSTHLGTSRILNMSNLRDNMPSNSSNQVGFVKVYSLYLDVKVDFVAYRRKLSDGVVESVEFRDKFGSAERGRNEVTLVREMGAERVLKRLNCLLRMLDRVLGCRPSGATKNNSLVLVALYQVVRDSFKLYAEVCDVLGVLLDRFSPRWSMSIVLLDRCVKAFFNSVQRLVA